MSKACESYVTYQTAKDGASAALQKERLEWEKTVHEAEKSVKKEKMLAVAKIEAEKCKSADAASKIAALASIVATMDNESKIRYVDTLLGLLPKMPKND